ncbi:MAG: hypothetical protein GYA50_01705 [Eubacteriaceae bacterium]|nr:hypothetical protein [Eubacteriaceae bacterium]
MQEFNELPCSIGIDYSEITGDYILPFAIALDLNSSILYPQSGELQRFCYLITGKGDLDTVNIDLDHITFALGGGISLQKITNITVAVNGIKQEIILGEDGNVLLLKSGEFNAEDDCEGLKFDFGLDKTDGIMSISFDLLDTYPVGQMEVILFGRDTIAKGLSICGPVDYEEAEYIINHVATGYQDATVSVPITVTPYVNVGQTKTYLCGDGLFFAGISACPGTVNGTCQFTITQNICVEVPIEIGSIATASNLSCVFGDVAKENKNVPASQSDKVQTQSVYGKTIKNIQTFFKKNT